MNKSMMSHIVSGIILVIGLMISEPWREIFLNTGSYALAGSITNWLAIYMLFEKVPMLYGSGVIPSRFEEFRSAIRTLILTQFFTKDHIQRFLSESQTSTNSSVSSLAETIDFDKIFKGLTDTILQSSFGSLLAMAGGASALEPLKEPVKQKLMSMLNEGVALTPNTSSNQSTTLIDTLYHNICTIVDARLAELTPKMVKEIVAEMIRQHLGWLVVWGAVFGGLIGALASFI